MVENLIFIQIIIYVCSKWFFLIIFDLLPLFAKFILIKIKNKSKSYLKSCLVPTQLKIELELKSIWFRFHSIIFRKDLSVCSTNVGLRSNIFKLSIAILNNRYISTYILPRIVQELSLSKSLDECVNLLRY